MASPAERRAEARQLLLEYALTSTTPGRALVRVGSHSRPAAQPPSGERQHPAEHWARELETAADSELERLLRGLRAELDAVRRRPLAELHTDSAEDLAELVLERGAGWDARSVAVALRTSERIVRRARVLAGRDPELGRPVELNGNGSRTERAVELVHAGMSVRAASALTGAPRSTISGAARRP